MACITAGGGAGVGGAGGATGSTATGLYGGGGGGVGGGGGGGISAGVAFASLGCAGAVAGTLAGGWGAVGVAVVAGGVVSMVERVPLHPAMASGTAIRSGNNLRNAFMARGLRGRVENMKRSSGRGGVESGHEFLRDGP